MTDIEEINCMQCGCVSWLGYPVPGQKLSPLCTECEVKNWARKTAAGLSDDSEEHSDSDRVAYVIASGFPFDVEGDTVRVEILYGTFLTAQFRR